MLALFFISVSLPVFAQADDIAREIDDIIQASELRKDNYDAIQELWDVIRGRWWVNNNSDEAIQKLRETLSSVTEINDFVTEIVGEIFPVFGALESFENCCDYLEAAEHNMEILDDFLDANRVNGILSDDTFYRVSMYEACGEDMSLYITLDTMKEELIPREQEYLGDDRFSAARDTATRQHDLTASAVSAVQTGFIDELTRRTDIDCDYKDLAINICRAIKNFFMAEAEYTAGLIEKIEYYMEHAPMPDLRVVLAVEAPGGGADLMWNSQALFRIDVINEGAKAALPCTIKITAEDERGRDHRVYVSDIPSLNAGESMTREEELQLNYEGNAVYTVEVDPDGLVVERDEGDNRYSVTVDVIAKPDLMFGLEEDKDPDIQAVKIWPRYTEEHQVGRETSIRAYIYNAGNKVSPPYEVNVTAGGEPADRVSVPHGEWGVFPGKDESVSASWKPKVKGYNKIVITIDPENKIEEFDESNNIYSTEVFVLPSEEEIAREVLENAPLPVPDEVDISVDITGYDETENKLMYTVTNNGNVNIKPYIKHFFYYGDKSRYQYGEIKRTGTFKAGMIEPGCSREYFTRVLSGNYMIQVSAAPFTRAIPHTVDFKAAMELDKTPGDNTAYYTFGEYTPGKAGADLKIIGIILKVIEDRIPDPKLEKYFYTRDGDIYTLLTKALVVNAGNVPAYMSVDERYPQIQYTAMTDGFPPGEIPLLSEPNADRLQYAVKGVMVDGPFEEVFIRNRAQVGTWRNQLPREKIKGRFLTVITDTMYDHNIMPSATEMFFEMFIEGGSIGPFREDGYVVEWEIDPGGEISNEIDRKNNIIRFEFSCPDIIDRFYPGKWYIFIDTDIPGKAIRTFIERNGNYREWILENQPGTEDTYAPDYEVLPMSPEYGFTRPSR